MKLPTIGQGYSIKFVTSSNSSSSIWTCSPAPAHLATKSLTNALLSSISMITLFSLIFVKYSSTLDTSNSFPKNLCPLDLFPLAIPSISNGTTSESHKAKNHWTGLANLNF